MLSKFLLTELVLLVLLATFTAASVEDYADFRAYKVELENSQQVELFQQLDIPVDVLNDIGPDGGTLDAVVAPKDRYNFEKALERLGASFKCSLENLKEVLDGREHAQSGPMEWTKYHSLEDIYNFIENLAKKFPRQVKLYTYGTSYEGRPLKGLKISYKHGNKAIFMESNIHAVEWISSATTTCFIYKLLTSNDPKLMHLKWNYDWIYVPVVNPDGFVRTKQPGKQLWRKNTKPTGYSNSSGPCLGTDLNRNFDDGHFKEAGYNIDVPCDHWYGGSSANSEPEVQALQSFFDKFYRKGYYCFHLAFHNFGNWILLPYGHTNLEFPPNYDQMMDASKGFVEAAAKKFGTKFVAGASGLINYPVSGSSKDWSYNERNVCYSATIELRPYTDDPLLFFLPAAQIKDVCAEVTDGLIGLIKRAEKLKICGCKERH